MLSRASRGRAARRSGRPAVPGAGAGRRGARWPPQRQHLGGPGEQELPRTRVGIDGDLDRPEQPRSQLDLIDHHEAVMMVRWSHNTRTSDRTYRGHLAARFMVTWPLVPDLDFAAMGRRSSWIYLKSSRRRFRGSATWPPPGTSRPRRRERELDSENHGPFGQGIFNHPERHIDEALAGSLAGLQADRGLRPDVGAGAGEPGDR